MTADAWRFVVAPRSMFSEYRERQLQILRMTWQLMADDNVLQVLDTGQMYHLAEIPQPFQTIVRNALQTMEPILNPKEPTP